MALMPLVMTPRKAERDGVVHVTVGASTLSLPKLSPK